MEWTGLREEERSGIARIGYKSWIIIPLWSRRIHISFITIINTLFLEANTLGSHILFFRDAVLGYCLVCDRHLRDNLE